MRYFKIIHNTGGKKTKPQLVSGFTLVELLVVASIITIITLVILAKHGSFNSTILLKSLAYDVALSVRQAQVYGISVRAAQSGGDPFDVGYGIYITSANPTTYVFFEDLDRDNHYDGEAESVEVFSVRRGYRLARFCALLPSGIERCAPGELTSLSVAFDRPDPEAIITSDLLNDAYASAYIEVESPGGTRMRIDVSSTGQISVGDKLL